MKNSKEHLTMARNLLHWRPKIPGWQNEIRELHIWGYRVMQFFKGRPEYVYSKARPNQDITYLEKLLNYSQHSGNFFHSPLGLFNGDPETLAWFWEIVKSSSEPGLVNLTDYRMENHHFFVNEGRVVINWWKLLFYTL